MSIAYQRVESNLNDEDLEAGSADSRDKQCRICLSTDEPGLLIAPCSCRGSAKWVHRTCLDEWRAQERVPHAFTTCPTCKFDYRVIEVEDERAMRKRDVMFAVFIARDSCGLIALTQAMIAILAFLLHALDHGGTIKALFPTRWAESHASHLAIGPYYVTAVFLLLAILGAVGTFLKLTNRMPLPIPRTNRRQLRRPCCERWCYGCCDGCYFFPDPYVCVWSHGSCEGCCDACCIGGCECSGGGGLLEGCMSGAAGEGSVVIIPILLVALGIFAIIGVVVGIFCSTIVFQRVVQRHVHLLAMRSETQRVVVVDLAAAEVELGGGNDVVFPREDPRQTLARGRGNGARTTTDGFATAV